MRQLKQFVISRAGTKPYWCLQNVRLGYGLAARHAYALLDWQNTQQHRNRNFPNGLAVPVYWNWTGTVDGVRKNWGHIGVRLPDGKIWTDGKFFSSVDEVSRNYLSGSSYLGWGESVEGVKVIELGETMLHRTLIKNAYYGISGRWPSTSEIEFHEKNSTALSLVTGFIKNNDIAWKKRDVIIDNQNKALAEKDAIIDNIREQAQEAQGALKDDLEAALAKVVLLTDQNEDLKQDLVEANKVDEQEVVENWVVRNAKRIWNSLFNRS